MRDCFCPPSVHPTYSLLGPQVQSDASYWHIGDCPTLCVVRPKDLLVEGDPLRCVVRGYPTDQNVIDEELRELHELAQRRDDPEAVAGRLGDPIRRRLQLSPLLQLRPPPIGLVFNRRRPDPQPFERIDAERWPIERPDPFTPSEVPATEVPVITTGRELARSFEDETPGLQLRHALNAILAQPEFRDNFSPPFQALIWSALDIAIYSAQLAAWFFKWRGPNGVRFRPRPAEIDPSLSVLFDRRPNGTQSGDNGLRSLPPRSPGTPRHPAYPSGHSTTYAAGSTILAAFFPDLRGELEQLADNAGLARLWAGIHYRSDHLWGLELGTCVAEHVLRQIRRACICPPDPCNPPGPCEPPPTYEDLQEQAYEHCRCCNGDDDCGPDEECVQSPSRQLPKLDPTEQPGVDPQPYDDPCPTSKKGNEEEGQHQ